MYRHSLKSGCVGVLNRHCKKLVLNDKNLRFFPKCYYSTDTQNFELALITANIRVFDKIAIHFANYGNIKDIHFTINFIFNIFICNLVINTRQIEYAVTKIEMVL